MSRILVGQRAFILTLAVAAVTVVFLHFWRIGTAPPGFYGDECSIAYNAYCICETGADEYGVRWPMFFRSFDTFTDPVNVYSVAVPVRIFGLHPWVARLPSGLYCLTACVAFFLLLRMWRIGEWVALGGSFVLSVIPWVFTLSRNCAFAGNTAALLGLVMGLILTDSALRQRSNWRAILAGAAWAFTIYAHQSARPVLALLGAGSCLVLWRPLARRWRVVLVITASALVVLLPLIISVLRSPEALTTRFEQVGIFQKGGSLTGVISAMASRYLDYFSPRFLFISGDDTLRHHTGWGGELYWHLAPLILAGLYVVVRYWRRQPRYRIVLVGLLVSPVSAALTVDRMHSTRSAYGVIFWLLLAMLGARWLWQRKGLWRKLLLLMIGAGTLEIGLYLHNYFGAYQARCRFAYQGELVEALKYCFHHLDDNQVLYISDSTFSPHGSMVNAELKPFLYAYVLFYGKIDPRKYQQTGFPMDTVRLYDNNAARPGLLLRCNYRWLSPTVAQWTPNVEPLPAGSVLLTRIPFQDLDLQYEIFKIP